MYEKLLLMATRQLTVIITWLQGNNLRFAPSGPNCLPGVLTQALRFMLQTYQGSGDGSLTTSTEYGETIANRVCYTMSRTTPKRRQKMRGPARSEKLSY